MNSIENFCPRLSIVVPCYKEEAVLTETTRRLVDLIKRMINDGMIAANSSCCMSMMAVLMQRGR